MKENISQHRAKMTSWIYLVISSFLEIGWMISLKQTNGFTKIVPIIFYALFGGGSAFCLSIAIKTIPIGMAYAIWLGVAVIGITIAEILYFNEPYKIFKIIFISLIIIGVVGLKISHNQ